MELKSFCKRKLPLVFVATCLPFLWAQTASSERVTIGKPAKLMGKRGESVQTKIPVSILPGFHVNSNTPSDEYLIPLSLTWTTLGAMEGGHITFPKPSSEKYEFSEKPLSVFTGNFDLTANFKVGAKAAAGPGVIAGKLRYQACNNKACFPPKTVDVTVGYQVQ